MTLIGLVIALVILGVALYLLDLIPMDGTIKRIIQVVVILAIVLWVIQSLGLLSMGPTLNFHR